MIKIVSKHFPFSGFKAMAVWPFVFVRKDMIMAYYDKTDRHEHIHGRQQVEMLAVGITLAVVLFLLGCSWWSLLALPVFLYWYGAEWLVKLCVYRNCTAAYKNLAFEREAYGNQYNVVYLDRRKLFAWVRYLRCQP